MADEKTIFSASERPTIETYDGREVGRVVGDALIDASALVAAIQDWRRNPESQETVDLLNYRTEILAGGLEELGLLEDWKRDDGEFSFTDTKEARNANGLNIEDDWRMRWKRQILLEV